jgi:hypothetical protein
MGLIDGNYSFLGEKFIVCRVGKKCTIKKCVGYVWSKRRATRPCWRIRLRKFGGFDVDQSKSENSSNKVCNS